MAETEDTHSAVTEPGAESLALVSAETETQYLLWWQARWLNITYKNITYETLIILSLLQTEINYDKAYRDRPKPILLVSAIAETVAKTEDTHSAVAEPGAESLALVSATAVAKT